MKLNFLLKEHLNNNVINSGYIFSVNVYFPDMLMTKVDTSQYKVKRLSTPSCRSKNIIMPAVKYYTKWCWYQQHTEGTWIQCDKKVRFFRPSFLRLTLILYAMLLLFFWL